jgi:outer membrane protein OmpA-like peptidoglycan-associated protein
VLLGNQYVAISFGSARQAELKDGDMLLSEPPLQMADLLKKTNGILDGSQQAIQNITLATAHLNAVSAKIDGGQGTVGALVNDKQLYSNLEATSTTLHATMLQAQTGVSDFQENMEALKHNFLLSGYFKKRGYDDSAELSANQIGGLPRGEPVKAFTYTAKQLFDGHDSAKLKNHKSLNAGGEFLAQNQFGFAVVVVSTDMEGDTQKDLLLTEARAMVIRRYLVENFGFDDGLLKTFGMGKQTDTGSQADWGSIQILVFPTGTEMPASKPEPAANSPAANPGWPIQVTTGITQKP